MLFALDDASILSLLVLIALVNASIVQWASRMAPSIQGPSQWAASLALTATMAALSVSPIEATSPWRGGLFNPLLIAAQLLWFHGTWQFSGRRSLARWLIGLFLIVVLFNTWFSFADPQRDLRIASVVSLAASLKLATAGLLLAYARNSSNRVAIVAAGSLGLESMVFLFHAYLAIRGEVPLFGSGAGGGASLIWLAMLLGVSVTAPLYMLMGLGRLVLDLRRAANRDSLTELRNRRGFFSSIEPLIAHGRRSKGHAAVLMLDIDRFKRLNDRFGHAVGDQVLRTMGATLRGTLRGSDVAVRWGGEEFCALLLNTDGKGAHTTAERIRHEFAAACKSIEALRGGAVSVSIGIAYGALADHDFDSLQKQADQALYAAKEAGRDRVVAGQSMLINE
ncbi:GGDEF domain-containing protein [Pseudomarimonas arenosa]|uniref:diguanylate cyclase n=1 Tax=Pseudomarimonas arenosa TaxID=2774145 RepID=A0AAW3ZKA3_9GAMM|nr:GGDEF domain-containing protein [Pseudomarimonas arenosa]MBD8525597.1 GGDEF domain-containing protein [Pseudomarimonas arenosa]